MSTISSLGVGSGMDIRGIVDDLVAAERKPEENRLDSKQERVETELSAMGKVESALGEFRSAVQSAQSGFDTITASSSDDAVSVNAGEDAQPGSVDLDVQQLAQSQSLAVGPAGADRDEPLGGGELTFRFGEVDAAGDGTVNGFTPSDDKGTVTVDIDPSASSMEDVRDAVNEADAGIRASIVNDGTQDRLVFNAGDTGVESGFVVDVDSDDAGSALNELAYNETSAPNASLNREAQDAELTIDGLAVTRPSNELDDVLDGASVTLNGTTDGAATVSVEEDASAAKEGVQGFVDGFNKLQGQLNELTAFDPESGESGPLNGDPLVRGLSNQLRNEISRSVDALEGRAVQSFADIGILTRQDGTLEFDESRLDAALAEDPRAVEGLFSETGLVEGSGFSLRNAADSAEAGRYNVTVSEAATRGRLETGVVDGFPLNVQDGENTFRVEVDGTRSGELSLAPGEYDNASDLAAELARTINGDQNLRDADASVDIEVQADNSLRMRSATYGSESAVAFDEVAATLEGQLSLGSATTTAGTDVQGTIDGVEAQGEGLQLTAFDGGAAGISVDIEPGATGNLGTLAFSKGGLNGLDQTLSRYLASDGLLSSNTDSLNRQMEQVETSRAELDERMTKVEERYSQEFSAMDSLVSELQQTGSFLQQQLGGGGGTSGISMP